MNVNFPLSWKKEVGEEFNKSYFVELVTFLKTERTIGKKIFPSGSLIFNAFELTPFEDIKVVIIGQDPYHGLGQAHGLSFSVPYGIKLPPSLLNIYKELQNDVGIPINVQNGNLTKWAQQGVLLLNAALTVREGEPFSHAKYGWAEFTNAVIKKISDQKENVIFLLWGKFAQEKENLIDTEKHYLLKAAHPSPFSADKGFFGCRHFSKTNEMLIKMGKSPIDWKIENQ